MTGEGTRDIGDGRPPASDRTSERPAGFTSRPRGTFGTHPGGTMCRLFGLSSAPLRTHATFWLLERPDSLSRQSHRDPDGTGLGHFAADGTRTSTRPPSPPTATGPSPRRPARRSRGRSSPTSASPPPAAWTCATPTLRTGRADLRAQRGHRGPRRLEAHLGEDRSLVKGDTDSERFFALITRETRRARRRRRRGHPRGPPAGSPRTCRLRPEPDPHHPQGAVGAALPGHPRAVRPSAAGRGRATAAGTWTTAASHGRMRVHSSHLADHPAVVVASERMDDNPHWRPLEPGELLHVDPPPPPHPPDRPAGRTAHQLTLEDLHPAAAASQKAA